MGLGQVPSYSGLKEGLLRCPAEFLPDEGIGPNVDTGLVETITNDVHLMVEKELPMHRKEMISVGEKTKKGKKSKPILSPPSGHG